MMKKRMAVFMTAAMLMAGSSVYAAEVSQAPQSGMNGQMPQGKGRGGMHRGGRDGRDHGRISFEDYQKDGTISQETYEAIMNYLKDPKEQRDLLSELLEKGIITQEEYDAMKTAEEAGQTTEQTTGQTTGQTTEQTTEQTTGQDQNTAENQPAA